MSEFNTINICDELHQNFIDFAYEANSQRAFPDARDGLKPGQRACLWEMYDKGYTSNKPHVKSANIAGGVIGRWWPHSDTSAYDTFARMSQWWINNNPEVDWHGQNGSIIIGNAPAADRYTEARLSKESEEGLFSSMKKNVVLMIPNYSEDLQWPEVLPALMPRLMINGSQGIGVTVANHWTCHNLKEICDVIVKYVAEGTIDYKNIFPDYPTGGIIINKDDLHTIYETGKGKIILRAKTEIKKNSIIITELPYQVFVEPFIDSVKELIKNDEITTIKDIYNKSNKRDLVIEIVCEDNPGSVLTKLFAKTELQKTINPNQYALVSKTPKLLNLKEYLDIYIEHNRLCIEKEFNFDLEKAKARLEIVNGLLIAMEDIDNVITLIKASKSSAEAAENLIKKYHLTERQAKAIIDMKLGRLANLEKVELETEKKELVGEIEKLENILSSNTNLLDIFIERLKKFSDKFGSPRKTVLTNLAVNKEAKEAVYVEPEKCVVLMTESGLIKRVPLAAFKAAKRNTVGVKTQDDITNNVIRTNTVDSLMVFTNKGTMYRLVVNDIPEGTNSTKGTPIGALIEMEAGEKPTIIYSIYKDTEAKYLCFITKNGMVKRSPLSEYTETKRKKGIAAINLKEGDSIASAFLMSDEPILILTEGGQGIVFDGSEAPITSRATQGVKGINLKDKDSVAFAIPLRNKDDKLAIITDSGLGKRVNVPAAQHRGGRGLQLYKPSSTAGKVIGAAFVADDDKVLIVGDRSSLCVVATDFPLLSEVSIGNQMIKNNHVKSISKV